MSAPSSDDQNLTPELGDIWTLKSTSLPGGSITGKIIYRDADTVRIQPFQNSSDRAVNIAMGEDGGFAEGTNITEAILHAKRSDPHFVAILGASEGERLEFFTAGGLPVDPDKPAIISEIIEDDENDVIMLTDGRRIDFSFIGPPAPYEVVRLRSADLDEQDTGESGEEAVEEEGLPDEYDLSLLKDILPAAMVEDIPTAEQSFPEPIQREDMYIDLLKDFTDIQQKNPTLLRRIARETELLLALKHAVTQVGTDGLTRPLVKSAESLKTILTRLGNPISSIIPVLAVKRILYYDPPTEAEPKKELLDQVEFRDWARQELESFKTSFAYAAGKDAGTTQVSTLLYTYLYNVLFLDGNIMVPSAAAIPGEEILVDQDVLRSVVPPSMAKGYPTLGTVEAVGYENVGPVRARQIRALSSLKTKSQNVIAPGDPGTALSYLLLPAHIGSTWRPTKFSGTLAEDIHAAELTKTLMPMEQITNNSNLYVENGIRVVKNIASQDGESADDIMIAEWVQQNLEQNVHPTDLLTNSGTGINRVLDSVGMRSYEWTPAVAKTIWSTIEKAQNKYRTAYSKFMQELEAEEDAAYQVGPGIPAKSSLYVKAMEVPSLADSLNRLSEISPEISEWDLAKAQHLLNAAESTLMTVLYKKIVDSPELKKAEDTYKAEVRRSLLQIASVNAVLARYKAKPEINTCPHVKDMNVLRQVMKRDESKFHAVLQRLLKRYQGARYENWIECRVCDSHLICMHEVMMLYERTHPGRAPALHKEILLDYGGAAFNGKYICRNCGIPISEFEYDSHLEFDDEGKPLMGRGGVEEEETSVEDELDAILDVALKKKKLTFDDPAQQELYDIARVMAQTAGFSLSEAVYQNIVEFTYLYISTTLPPREEYEAMTAKRKKAPPYEAFKATTQVAITAAYIICQIHYIQPLPEVLFPFPGCEFKRGGYPIEVTINQTNQGEEEVMTEGAMTYVACVLGNINRSSDPWDRTVWATESSPDRRQAMATDWIMRMFGDPKIKSVLKKTRASYKKFSTILITGASSKDKVSPSFRPIPNTNPIIIKSQALYPDRILVSAKDAPLSEIQPVVDKRNYELAITSVQNAHKLATDNSIVNEKSVRSDGACCYTNLETAKGGLLSIFNPEAVALEVNGLIDAQTMLRKRNPIQQSNGTHLWVRWSPPDLIPSLAVSPESAYFKMFMRNCFRDDRIGEPHEFGRRDGAYICRHCNFRVERDPLILMSDLGDEEIRNADTKRKGPPSMVVQEEARTTLKSNGQLINEATFDTLLSAIRKNRLVDPPEPLEVPGSVSIFEALNENVKTNCPFMKERMADWALVEKAMVANFARKGPPTNEARKITWAQFVSRYDTLRNSLLDVLEGRQGKAPVKGVRKVEEVLSAIERITEDPVYQGPSELNKHWVVGLERLARGFSEMVFGVGTWFGKEDISSRSIRTYLFGGSKWFGKKISQRHTSKFEEMIEKILGANTDTNKELSKPAIRKRSSEILHKLASYFSTILKLWLENMPSFSVWGVTNEELRYILRWLVLSSVESLLLIDSPLYKIVSKDSEKTQIQTILLEWVKINFMEAKRQFDQFGLTEDEIRLAILDAKEKEKNTIIKEIDDEKDPDLRAVALVQKGLKIGRWGVGNKNPTSYNAEFWDFLQDQRDRVGQVDRTNQGPDAAVAAANADAVGYMFRAGEANVGYDNRGREDEDEGGAME